MADVLPFRPTAPLVVIAYDRTGWLVYVLDETGERRELSELPIAPMALDLADELGDRFEAPIVYGPGISPSWPGRGA